MQMVDAIAATYFENGPLAQERRPWLLAASVAGSAALVLAAFVLWPAVEAVFAAVALVTLVACAATDLASFRIPNALTYSGTGLLLIATTVLPDASFVSAVLGALLGYAVMGALSLVSRGKVGLGDAKLSALGGALVGVDLVIKALFLGTMAAGVLCLVLMLRHKIGRSTPLPYAPFLSFGFIATALAAGTTLGL